MLVKNTAGLFIFVGSDMLRGPDSYGSGGFSFIYFGDISSFTSFTDPLWKRGVSKLKKC